MLHCLLCRRWWTRWTETQSLVGELSSTSLRRTRWILHLIHLDAATISHLTLHRWPPARWKPGWIKAPQSFNNITSSCDASFWTPGSRLGGKKRFVGMKMLTKLQILMTLPATSSYPTAIKNVSKHLYAIMHSCKYLLLKDMVLSWTWKAYKCFYWSSHLFSTEGIIRHEVVWLGRLVCVALAPRPAGQPHPLQQRAVRLTPSGTRRTSGDAANVSSTELPAGRTLVGLSLETKFGVGVQFLETLDLLINMDCVIVQ